MMHFGHASAASIGDAEVATSGRSQAAEQPLAFTMSSPDMPSDAELLSVLAEEHRPSSLLNLGVGSGSGSMSSASASMSMPYDGREASASEFAERPDQRGRLRSQSLGVDSVETVSATGVELSSPSIRATDPPASSKIMGVGVVESVLHGQHPPRVLSSLSEARYRGDPGAPSYMQAHSSPGNAHASLQRNIHNLKNGGRFVPGQWPLTLPAAALASPPMSPQAPPHRPQAPPTSAASAAATASSNADFLRHLQRIVGELEGDHSLSHDQKLQVLDAYVARYRQHEIERERAENAHAEAVASARGGRGGGLEAHGPCSTSLEAREEFARRAAFGTAVQQFRDDRNTQAAAEAHAARVRAESEAAALAEAEARALQARKLEQLRKLERALASSGGGGAGGGFGDANLSPEQMEQLRRALRDPTAAAADGSTPRATGGASTAAYRSSPRGVHHMASGENGRGVSPVAYGGGALSMQPDSSHSLHSSHVAGVLRRQPGLTPASMSSVGGYIPSRAAPHSQVYNVSESMHQFTPVSHEESSHSTFSSTGAASTPSSLSSGVLASLQSSQQERFDGFLNKEHSTHSFSPQLMQNDRDARQMQMAQAARHETILRQQAALRVSASSPEAFSSHSPTLRDNRASPTPFVGQSSPAFDLQDQAAAMDSFSTVSQRAPSSCAGSPPRSTEPGRKRQKMFDVDGPAVAAGVFGFGNATDHHNSGSASGSGRSAKFTDSPPLGGNPEQIVGHSPIRSPMSAPALAPSADPLKRLSRDELIKVVVGLQNSIAGSSDSAMNSSSSSPTEVGLMLNGARVARHTHSSSCADELMSEHKLRGLKRSRVAISPDEASSSLGDDKAMKMETEAESALSTPATQLGSRNSSFPVTGEASSASSSSMPLKDELFPSSDIVAALSVGNGVSSLGPADFSSSSSGSSEHTTPISHLAGALAMSSPPFPVEGSLTSSSSLSYEADSFQTDSSKVFGDNTLSMSSNSLSNDQAASTSSSSAKMPEDSDDTDIEIDTSKTYYLSDSSGSLLSSTSNSRSSSCFSEGRVGAGEDAQRSPPAATSSSPTPSPQCGALIPVEAAPSHSHSPSSSSSFSALASRKKRPRYRKRVCQNCFEAKAACDAQRPCGRCVRLHKPLCRDRRPEKRAPQKRGGVPLLPTSYLALFGIEPSTLENFDLTTSPTVHDWAEQQRAVMRATASVYTKLKGHISGQSPMRILHVIQTSVDYVGFDRKADRVAFQEELQGIVGLAGHKMPKSRVKLVKGQSLFSNTTDFLPRRIEREMDTHCGIARTQIVGMTKDGDWHETVRTFEYNKRLQQMFGFTKAEMTRYFAKNRLRYAQHMNADDWHSVFLKGVEFYEKMRNYTSGYRIATVYRLVRKDGSSMPVIELRTSEIKANVGNSTLILIPLAL